VSARRAIFIVLSLIFVAMVVSVGGLVVMSLFVTTPAPVSANSTLYLTVRAPFSEIEPSDVVSQFLKQPPTLRATIDSLRKAKVDTRVSGLVIRPAAAGALWAQVQEIRGAIEDFKTSGKPVTAFLEAGSAQEYYLASVADRIAMMPAGQLDLAGLASYEVFFRGALDKIGVFPDLLHIGDYKTASNTFTEKTFTPAHREMTTAMNKDWYDELVRAVGQGRKLDASAARAVVDGGPYEDQLDDKAPIQGTRRLEADAYASVPVSLGPRDSGGRIALLYATGTIASGTSSFDGPGGMVVGSDTLVQWLRKVRVDPGIRAVVLRVDSPGGSAIASEVIWRELMLTRDVKPLVVSMGDVAASGGYYIAAPAHAIVAEPGTITGSIGVVTGKFVVQGGLEKLGITTGTVKAGPSADIYSPFRPFLPAERARLEDQMQATYELFLSRVATGRNQPADKIDAIAKGRVWTGHQARELGLVDELGGLQDAMRIAKQRAKLDPKQEVDLVVYPAKRSFYELVSNPFGMAAEAALLGPAALERHARSAIFVRPEVRLVESSLATIGRFRRGELLMLMPNIFLN
jgi:protease-4